MIGQQQNENLTSLSLLRISYIILLSFCIILFNNNSFIVVSSFSPLLSSGSSSRKQYYNILKDSTADNNSDQQHLDNDTTTKFSTVPTGSEIVPNNNDNNNNNGSSNSNNNDNKNNIFGEESILKNIRNRPNKKLSNNNNKKKMELIWCSGHDNCKEEIDLRERTVGEHNQILLTGPATGQVAYFWHDDDNDNESNLVNGYSSSSSSSSSSANRVQKETPTVTKSVLLLVKQGGNTDNLLSIAAEAVHNLTSIHDNIQILLDPKTAARLEHNYNVNGNQIRLYELIETPCKGFGNYPDILDVEATSRAGPLPIIGKQHIVPDLICTIGGDGLLMYAAMLFQGPIPPILCVSGGSLGFLTTFQPNEMVEAVEISLGLKALGNESPSNICCDQEDDNIPCFPPNMDVYNPLSSIMNNGQQEQTQSQQHKFTFGLGDRICLSIRMRLDCRILNRQGDIKVRYNVLNEVVIDRGSSPYLAALECFVDDVHLTTVQADGVIFATPTGSTAYSLAAGSSVVHPAVPCILVTPICPHVLSFRSMVFPDHVILRCYVPDDARSEASVAFDGKHRQVLRRGDSVQIRMSAYPVPTINRKDHSSDWLDSLKRNFNFNARPRQSPL